MYVPEQKQLQLNGSCASQVSYYLLRHAILLVLKGRPQVIEVPGGYKYIKIYTERLQTSIFAIQC